VPPFYYESVKDVIPKVGGQPLPGWLGWSPEKALAAMDENGIAVALVSYTNPGVWLNDIQKSRDLARRCNEFSAQLAHKYPDRFGFFAAIPLPDIQGSLEELSYSLDILKADGIGLMTSYGDKWLGDPIYMPVFEELNRRQSVVYVHPASPSCCRNLIPHVPPFVTEFVQDTNRAITSLLFSGALSRLGDIKFIFSHAGGSIPMLSGRIAQLARNVPSLGSNVPNGVEVELQRLHYEIANSAHRPAFAALMSLVPSSQIMFGSDYPYIPISATANGLQNVGLSPNDLAGIARNNAINLFPKLDGIK
jgi:predicted TIM-barrel fold metal-dependent hydrolase